MKKRRQIIGASLKSPQVIRTLERYALDKKRVQRKPLPPKHKFAKFGGMILKHFRI